MTEINPERQNGKKQRIRYSEEYRMNAARMVLIDGFSVEKAAASPGCGRESIRKCPYYSQTANDRRRGKSVPQEVKLLSSDGT